MIFNILDNTTELWMTKDIIGEIFSSGGATLYKNLSDQTVSNISKNRYYYFPWKLWYTRNVERISKITERFAIKISGATLHF